MIPLRDNIPSRTVPVVNYSLIAACAVAFVFQLMEQPDEATLAERLGMIPARVLHPDQRIEIPVAARVTGYEVRQTRDGRLVQVPIIEEVRREAAPSPVPPILTLLTCIFLHGGWMHFLGNMWFLHIFGDNVEDRFGHWGYLVFYLVCGVAASITHLVTGPGSTVPTIGASGAIAGVMGAYLVSYPHARVLAVIPIFFFLEMLVLPAPIFLGIWFVIQFFQGVATITDVQTTGVAWWAHIGGFVAGAAAAWLLGKGHALRPRNEQIRPATDRMTHYRIGRRPPW
jgi:membrane associated rhomboid family serine protease